MDDISYSLLSSPTRRALDIAIYFLCRNGVHSLFDRARTLGRGSYILYDKYPATYTYARTSDWGPDVKPLWNKKKVSRYNTHGCFGVTIVFCNGELDMPGIPLIEQGEGEQSLFARPNLTH